MKSFRDRNPYIVGILSVLGIMGIVGGAFSIGILHVGEKVYDMTAIFSDGAGMQSGNQVRIAGVGVGMVTGIQPDRVHGNVKITFKVNDNIKLGDQTHAEVALATLLGTKYLRLTDTTRGAPYKDMLPAQRVIPLVDGAGVQRTKVPFEVFDTLKASTRSIEATDAAKLNKLITSLADITQGNKDDIARLLQGVTDLSDTLNSRETQLKELLDRAQRLSGVLADKDKTLVALVDQSKRILDVVNARRNDISGLLQDGNALVVELIRLLDADKANLDAALKSLHPTLQTVAANQADLDKGLAIAGPGAYGLAISSAHGPWQDIYVQAIGPDLVALLGTLGGT